jgi:hypothetical protein
MPAGDPKLITDGAVDFSGGVDSISVTTTVSQDNPDGLDRNELAWLNNATVRDGGISPRWGNLIKGMITNGSQIYQGGIMYTPPSGNPYLLLLIGGHLWAVNVDFSSTPVDLSQQFNLFMPASQPYAYFAQGEQFAIIQAGDYVTLPLFWDGYTLTRSIGITNNAIAVPAPGINQIPAAGPMVYYEGRLWYAINRTFAAGDMVASHNSGTPQYQYRDSILNVTESPLCFGGDGFTVPSTAGSITVLTYNANLNQILGQGQLIVGTQQAAYAMSIPVTRADWINTTSSSQPQQVPVILGIGPINDRSVVQVNGDLFFQTLTPGVASLLACTRDFTQWGNRDISSNEYRALSSVNRALLPYATGILFDNRLLESSLPSQRSPGVVHQAILPLDFVPISNFGANFDVSGGVSSTTNPTWEGMLEGLDVLQLFSGNFGGLARAFAVILSRVDGSIQLYELTTNSQNDVNPSGQSRIIWQAEFPSFNVGRPWDMKKLVSMELWIDNLVGEVEFQVDYRPDGDTCWHPWYNWEMDVSDVTPATEFTPLTYPPTTPKQSYVTVTLPKPPEDVQSVNKRPVYIGYQFQPRLTVKGYCRLRGIMFHVEQIDRKLYDNIPNPA